jgi:putative endonuclease
VAGAWFGTMYVYIIRSSKDGSFYVGTSKNVTERIKQHNRRENLSTKSKIPWELVRLEEYRDDSLALKREKFLKTSRGRRILRNFL